MAIILDERVDFSKLNYERSFTSDIALFVITDRMT